MRTINIKPTIDPNTFQPMANLYFGEIYTGVKYSLELRHDLKCMDDESKDMVMESFFTSAIEAVLEAVPDITETEMQQLLLTCKNASL
jgi:hypothetical protein